VDKLSEDAWGPAIDTTAGRPKWLGLQEPYVWMQTDIWLDHTRTRHTFRNPFARTTKGWCWRTREGDVNIRAIRLPADHPAYVHILATTGATDEL